MEISSEYLKILQNEGTKVRQSCFKLNADKKFTEALYPLTNADFHGVQYKPAHILMYDVVKIFNIFLAHYGSMDSLSEKAKFILIYIYEHLQDNDLGKKYDLSMLNKIALSSQFNQNFNLIRETTFFKPDKNVENEFILPAVLFKINSDELTGISSFLNRVAALVAKADNTITLGEKELLKKISDKINSPKDAIKNANYNEVSKDDTLEIVLKELHELIGMDNIKKNIEDLTNFLQVQKMREKSGLKTAKNSLHSVFLGPPGTGKTTVARLLGRIFKHLGYLKKGHFVETDRAGLVAGYVGQTAIKTNEIITTAEDGVLFIDEAYSLSSEGLNDFGHEAIEILLKRMEDKRSNFVVVVAGYPDEMKTFIQSNPGLQSRFNRYFEFDHFDVPSLLNIFKLYVKNGDFLLTEDAEEKLLEIIERLHEKRNSGFGNARTMRNLFEKIIERQANRIVSITPITKKILVELTEDDIPPILKTVKEMCIFEEEE